jgi:hypothetical protein
MIIDNKLKIQKLIVNKTHKKFSGYVNQLLSVEK